MPKTYTKEEIFEIFQSQDINFMRSFINKDTIRNPRFTEQERVKLTQNLKVSLVDIIDEPDDFHGYNFKPVYYNLFGDEYVRALFELVGEDFKGFEYHFGWIWSLNKYSMPILKAKLHGSLSELHFTNKHEFCLAVSIISSYFGSRELLRFLDAIDHFNILYSMIPCENEGDHYLLSITLITISSMIISHITSSNKDERQAATQLHQDLMKLLRYNFMEAKHINSTEVIFSLLDFFNKRNQVALISSTIKSIPESILNEFLNNPRLMRLNKIIRKALE